MNFLIWLDKYLIIMMMEKFFESCTSNLLLLSECFELEYGEHYPKELVLFIMRIYYRLYSLKMSCGVNYQLILFDGKVYSRRNGKEQLGFGNTMNSFQLVELPFIKQITCTYFSYVALTDKGEVYSWGSYDNGHGYLSSIPEKLTLPPIKKIFCGGSYTLALSVGNSIYLWGQERETQGGMDCYSVFGKGSGRPRKLNLTNITKFVCGGYHTITFDLQGKICSAGSNQWGQLGLGHGEETYELKEIKFGPMDKVVKIACGVSHSMALTKTGEIYAWGNNSKGQLGLGHYNVDGIPHKLNLSNVKNIWCGGYYSVAVTIDNEFFIWGDNKNKQSEDMYINSPMKISFDYIKNPVKKIICGPYHAFIVTVLNEIYNLDQYLDQNNSSHIPEKIIF